MLQHYEIVKHEWDSYNSIIAKGSMIRSKCNWVEHGEKCSRYFLNLEKYNYEKKTITLLNVNDKPEPIVQKGEILEELERFYQNLYTEKSQYYSEDAKRFTVQNDVPQLSKVESRVMARQLSENECWEAILELSNGKTPGTDSIPIEF